MWHKIEHAQSILLSILHEHIQSILIEHAQNVLTEHAQNVLTEHAQIAQNAKNLIKLTNFFFELTWIFLSIFWTCVSKVIKFY